MLGVFWELSRGRCLGGMFGERLDDWIPYRITNLYHDGASKKK